MEIKRNYTILQSKGNANMFKLVSDDITTLHVVSGKDVGKITEMPKAYAVNFIKSNSTLHTAMLNSVDNKFYQILSNQQRTNDGKIYYRLNFNAFNNAFVCDKIPLKIDAKYLEFTELSFE